MMLSFEKKDNILDEYDKGETFQEVYYQLNLGHARKQLRFITEKGSNKLELVTSESELEMWLFTEGYPIDIKIVLTGASQDYHKRQQLRKLVS